MLVQRQDGKTFTCHQQLTVFMDQLVNMHQLVQVCIILLPVLHVD